MNPRDLITKQDVEKVLKQDKGEEAKVKEFKYQDFTKKGDNFTCLVTRVIVDNMIGIENYRTTYVVKINPCRSKLFKQMSEVLFRKEIGFYTKILPLLNAELQRVDEPELKLPRFIYCVSDPSKEIMYFRDLQREDFKLYGRKEYLDCTYVQLVLKELARFHAASVLLFTRYERSPECLLEKFPFLEDAYELMKREKSAILYEFSIPNFLETAACIAERLPGYEHLAEKLRNKKVDAIAIYNAQMTTAPQFQTLVHADFWNNNFLFK